MKKIIFIVFAVLAIGFPGNAQKLSKKDIPANVLSTLDKLYPKTTNVKWVKENSEYESSFIYNSKKTSVTIDEKGSLIETEEEISITMIPKTALNYFHKTYPKDKIKETAKITDNKGNLIYEIGLEKSDLLFDDKGNFINKK